MPVLWTSRSLARQPIVVGAAAGVRLTLNTEFVTFVQDDEGVTSTVRDTGREYSLRSRDPVGADGARLVSLR